MKRVATGTKVECYIQETAANNFLIPILTEFISLFGRLLSRWIKRILGQKERKICKGHSPSLQMCHRGKVHCLNICLFKGSFIRANLENHSLRGNFCTSQRSTTALYLNYSFPRGYCALLVTYASNKTTTQVARSHIHIHLFPAAVQRSSQEVTIIQI